MNVGGNVRELTCPVCGEVFTMRSATKKYCSKACCARAPRKRGAKKASRVDSFLAGTGAAHDEISAMRAELAALRYYGFSR